MQYGCRAPEGSSGAESVDLAVEALTRHTKWYATLWVAFVGASVVVAVELLPGLRN